MDYKQILWYYQYTRVRHIITVFDFIQIGGVNMLVIGRRAGEYVVIDDNIIVKVVKSEDGDIRLAIDAPRDIRIVRGELYEQELLQNAQ